MKLKSFVPLILIFLSVLLLKTEVGQNLMTSFVVVEEEHLIGHVKSIVQEKEFAPVEIYFCPRQNCSAQFEKKIIEARKSVHCALFDLDLEELITAFEERSQNIDVKLVIDKNNDKETNHLDFVKFDNNNQLTHNKFCIFDNKTVWTGSFNPTYNGNYKNSNNVLVLHSKTLAENYEAEFAELWNGKFSKGDLVENPLINLSGKRIVNAFCPEDWCSSKVINEISKAKSSIYMMIFSFTHDQIGDAIIEKHEEGLEIKGIFEKSQNNKYHEFPKLNDAGIEVKWDSNTKSKLHHKVFIIDNKTVITGSFNPSKNGDTRNDENLLIIEDEEITKKFLEEFNQLFG